MQPTVKKMKDRWEALFAGLCLDYEKMLQKENKRCNDIDIMADINWKNDK